MVKLGLTFREACELEIERLQQQHHDRKAEWSRERLQLQEERDELSLQSRDTHSRLTLASEAATQVRGEGGRGEGRGGGRVAVR